MSHKKLLLSSRNKFRKIHKSGLSAFDISRISSTFPNTHPDVIYWWPPAHRGIFIVIKDFDTVYDVVAFELFSALFAPLHISVNLFIFYNTRGTVRNVHYARCEFLFTCFWWSRSSFFVCCLLLLLASCAILNFLILICIFMSLN